MKITKAQIKFIHVLKSKANIDETVYRLILAKYNVLSSTELSIYQAAQLIEELKKAAGEIRVKNKASSAQINLIETLWKEVSYKKTDQERKKALNKFLERFGVSHIKWLETKTVQKVISALKTMKNQIPRT